LGLTADEFWKSTLAQVTALYHVKVLTWDRARDFFPAQMTAVQLNRTRKDATDKAWTAEELLLQKYPKPPKSVMITQDPDRGAGGNWKELKSALKGKTASQAAKMKRRKIYARV
jgi:hypothetical protein